MKSDKEIILEKLLEVVKSKRFKGKTDKLRALACEYRDAEKQKYLPSDDEKEGEV